MFGTKLKTKDEIQSTHDRLNQEIASAEKRLAELAHERDGLLLDGSPQELVDNTRSRELHAAVIDQAKARLAANGRAAEALAEKTEDDRRKAVYQAALKKRAEGIEHLKNYDKNAAAAASALLGYLASKVAIVDANGQLPEGSKPIADPEPDNSEPMYRRPDAFVQRAVAHVSVLDRAVIPRVARSQYFYGEHNFGELKR